MRQCQILRQAYLTGFKRMQLQLIRITCIRMAPRTFGFSSLSLQSNAGLLRETSLPLPSLRLCGVRSAPTLNLMYDLNRGRVDATGGGLEAGGSALQRSVSRLFQERVQYFGGVSFHRASILAGALECRWTLARGLAGRLYHKQCMLTRSYEGWLRKVMS